MTDFNEMVEAEIERHARQWEKTEARLHERILSLHDRVRELEARLEQRFLLKADVSKDPHWLLKDFNVLYRVLARLVQQADAGDVEPTALAGAKLQLERLKPAFTDTEEVRKAMRGE